MARPKKKVVTPEVVVKSPIIKPEDINEESLRYLSRDSFALWALNKGITVDNHVFSFDDFKFLLPLYMDNSIELVLVKAAQLGATVYQILWLIWFLEQHQGTKAGLYFPNKDLADNTSKDRITPMLESSPEIYKMTDPADKLSVRRIGKSTLYVMYLEGKSSKDSVPLDALSFDEVRLSSQMSIDQTMERIAASKFKYRRYMSTCFSGDQEIIVRPKIVPYTKVQPAPECRSFYELRTCWSSYDALSFDKNERRYVFKPITAFHSNGEKQVVSVSFDDGRSVVCTPDHQFAWSSPLPNSKTKHVKFLPISRALQPHEDSRRSNNSLLSLVNLSNISKKEIQAPYDIQFFYIMGSYVAEGSFVTDTVIRIAQLKERPIWDQTIDWAIRNNLNYTTGDTYVNVSLCSRPDLLQLFRETGGSCDRKCIPESILKGSTNQLRSFIEGFVEGDGTMRAEDRWEITTTSKKLSEQLNFVALRIGYPTFVRTRPLESGKTKYEVSGSLNGYRLFGRKNNQRYNQYFRLGKVVSITDVAAPTSVFDLTVEDNHNYILSNGFVAHNCGLPNDTIHKRFLRGTQHIWHSTCGCPDGVDLARTFPHCVVDDPKRGVYLRCPKCKYTINDAQNGRYVPHNPSADVRSYSVSQLASKRISIKEIWEFYKTTTNIAEFYNGKLGLPWVDEDNRGVSMDQLEACIDDTQQWGTSIRGSSGCAMGVDQGAGYVVAVIGDLMDNGKKRIRHVEIVENNNPRYMENGEKVTPFNRLRELMKEYDVRICVVDAMPNSNDALQFAQDFRSRVFLAWYQRDAKHVVQWGDKRSTGEGIRKAGSFLKFKYTVTLSRYLSMGAMLGAWENGNYVIPEPDKLVQVCRSEETNQLVPLSPARRMFDHHCRLIKQFTVTNEDTGEGKHEWIYTGGDPHLSHASNYLNVGLERLGKRVIFTFA